jgi:hypothetical protein
MTKRWRIRLGLFLIVISIILYIIHYSIFREPRFISRLLVAQLAFLPISVLLITVIINQLLSTIKKKDMLEKLNMLTGVFCDEVGTELLSHFFRFDLFFDKIRKNLIVTNNWSDKDFANAVKLVKGCDFRLDSRRSDLEILRKFLVKKRDFLLRLLENPNLLEHESFTDLLWAVFHLTDELEKRENLKQLPDTDYEHISDDMKRAYILLIYEWLSYMKHLKNRYPYLYSLAVRINPFNPDASPIVE